MKKKKCKHNGGKGYWNILPGCVCLQCGKELIERRCAGCKKMKVMQDKTTRCRQCFENKKLK